MAPQTQPANLLKKYGPALQKAFEAHKGDETVTSNFGDLPEGIENGVAQLVECKFDVYKEGQNKGDVFFYAAGVVQLPVEVGGVPVEGLRTSIMEPVCDTPGRTRATVDAHIQWILNQMRLLGVNTAGMNVSHLEAAAGALKKGKPYFRFRTWKGKPSAQYPDPKVNHTWSGLVDYKPSANGKAPALKDEQATHAEGGEEPQEEAATKPAPKAAGSGTKPPAKRPTAKKAPEPEPEQPAAAVFDDGADDLDALAKDADDNNSKAAKARLTEVATEAGVEEEVTNADTWADAVEIIRAAQGVVNETSGGEGGGGDEAEGTGDVPAGLAEGEEPEVEQVWNYCPVNPKNLKQRLPAVECHVTAVSKKKSTVTLKENKGGKEHKDVPWGDLISA